MLGVVGLGAIGGLVADTAIKLGMKVIGFDPEITVDAAWRLHSGVRRAHGIEEVLKQSDFVTLHVPLLPVTRKLIDAPRLAVMKPGAILLNFARDGIVDEDAVLHALASQRLRAYITDFPTPSSCGQPGVDRAASPRRIDRGSRGELRDHGGRPGARVPGARHIRNAVNFPERRDDARVAVSASRSPTRTCRTCWARSRRPWPITGLNIHNMVNKSRGEMAYTLVDVDSPVDDRLIAALAAIEGVLSVRAIPAEA